MAELLAFEEAASRANSDVVLEECLFSDEAVAPTAANIPTPLGKFVMYPGWQPDTDFCVWRLCGDVSLPLLSRPLS